jgi:trans-2,3-dihydro-3-hydroxyanthranilate isomerase
MKKGTYTFAVDGASQQRRSVLNLEMDHKGEDTLTIRVGGEAVMVAEGTMTIPIFYEAAPGCHRQRHGGYENG